MTFRILADLGDFTGEPPKKRRKVHDTEPGREASSPVNGDDHNMDVDQPFAFGGGFGDFREFTAA